MRIVLDCDNGKDPTTVFFFFLFFSWIVMLITLEILTALPSQCNSTSSLEPVPFLCHVSVPVSGLYASQQFGPLLINLHFHTLASVQMFVEQSLGVWCWLTKGSSNFTKDFISLVSQHCALKHKKHLVWVSMYGNTWYTGKISLFVSSRKHIFIITTTICQRFCIFWVDPNSNPVLILSYVKLI